MLSKVFSKRRKTVFFHVMKTGGMTFRGILASIYGDGFHVCDDPTLHSVKAKLARYDCVEFHMQAQDHDWVNLHTELARERRWDLLQGMNVFTMFRDPVDQIVSLYYFMVQIRREIEPLMQASGVAFPESIDQFLDYRENFNNQTAFMVGKSQHGGKFIGREDLAEAKGIIGRLGIHVGLTERFTDALAIFQNVTGRRLPDTGIVVENRNQARPAIAAVPPHVKDRIREESALDLELYAFAREAFQADFARCAQPARRFSFALPAPASMQARFALLKHN